MNNVVGQAVEDFASATKGIYGLGSTAGTTQFQQSMSGGSYTTLSTTPKKKLVSEMGSVKQQSVDILNIMQKAEEQKKQRMSGGF